jgi:hypothetical protein
MALFGTFWHFFRSTFFRTACAIQRYELYEAKQCHFLGAKRSAASKRRATKVVVWVRFSLPRRAISGHNPIVENRLMSLCDSGKMGSFVKFSLSF